MSETTDIVERLHYFYSTHPIVREAIAEIEYLRGELDAATNVIEQLSGDVADAQHDADVMLNAYDELVQRTAR